MFEMVESFYCFFLLLEGKNYLTNLCFVFDDDLLFDL